VSAPENVLEPTVPDPMIHLLLVDPDPVFRLGLRLGLGRFRSIVVAAEAESSAIALEKCADSLLTIDVVVLDIGVSVNQPDALQGLELCQRIKATQPDRPVLMLSARSEAVIVAAAQQAGADGFCPRQATIEAIAEAIRRVYYRQGAWATRLLNDGATSATSSTEPSSTSQNPSLSWWVLLRQQVGQSGLQQIETALRQLTDAAPNLLDQLIQDGRRRELQAARWIVSRWVMPSGSAATPPNSPPEPNAAAEVLTMPMVLETRLTAPQDIRATLFDAILAKLAMPLVNQSQVPLEIDILNDAKRRELLYLVLRRFEQVIDELRYSKVSRSQLSDKRSPILLDLWQEVTTDFFGRYYTVTVGDRTSEVVERLLEESDSVQIIILDHLPFVEELLTHLLFQAPLTIDANSYPVGNPAAIARAQLILENLMLQLGNAVVQPLLNRFATAESIKHDFYDRRYMSYREIERFRNDLSWRYRIQRLVGEPTQMFESRYALFTLQGRAIRRVSVYASRDRELETLSGLPYAVTLALEARDAIAPRLRTAIAFVGSGVIYLLTDVIGRGIGLVGRGILKGVGDAWQDSRFNRNGEKQK
jgi:DNA-binding NarL/FixJ family response regulator